MKNLFLLFAAMLITACSSDDFVDSTDCNDNVKASKIESEISVSKDGYLVFPTSQSLEAFVVMA